MSLPDSNTHLTRPFGCKRGRAVRHWDGPSRIPSILPQQEGHQGAPLPRLVHMKYLAVVTVACCDFIGHVLPGQPLCHATSWQSSACSIFRLSFVIRTHAGIVSLPLPSSNIQRHSLTPSRSISSPPPLNFKSQTWELFIFRLILLLCQCWTSFSNSLISSAIVLPGE